MENNTSEKLSGKTPGKEGEASNQELKVKRKLSARQTFAALKFPNYRLWFFGQMTSLFGSWMQTTAQGFLVFELTHSSAYLGYVGFASGLPAWLFMMYGGVIADRFPRRSILIVTQILMMLQAFILSALTFTHLVQPWHIILLAFTLGMANAFDAPSRQAFVYELVDREYMMNAIALNSTMFNTATAVGPAIAGITYALFGPQWCFTINGISFIGVIIPLAMMKLKKVPHREIKKNSLFELKEGLLYVKNQKMILTIIVLIVMTSIFGLALVTLFPAWAVEILHGDATTNGFMQSSRGLGALISALFIASVSGFMKKGKLLSTGFLVLPVLILIFSFLRSTPIALLLLVVIGFAFILVFNVANAAVQDIVSEDFRGRVMGVYSFAFFGFMPIGALFIGTIAEHFGDPTAVLINAVILLIFAIRLLIKVPALKTMK